MIFSEYASPGNTSHGLPSFLDELSQRDRAEHSPFSVDRARGCSVSVSPLIRFGTSTWAYEGWQGLVYQKPYPKGRFKKDCLTEYPSISTKESHSSEPHPSHAPPPGAVA
jgi:hypothetical protein